MYQIIKQIMLQCLLQMSEYTGVQLLKFPKMVLIVCLLTIKYMLMSIKSSPAAKKSYRLLSASPNEHSINKLVHWLVSSQFNWFIFIVWVWKLYTTRLITWYNTNNMYRCVHKQLSTIEQAKTHHTYIWCSFLNDLSC